MKLFIQIPCYNEAATLKVTLDDLPKKIDGIDEIKVLIINDGSKDDTVQVAKDLGVDYIVNFRRNRGLAYGFMAGIDACLHLGADIIVNTDADNQYSGFDIEKLVRPIIDKQAEVVIGARPIDDTPHFSKAKKKFQHLGSYVVQKASNSDMPDAPSGFRAYSRQAAMRLNVINEYTYTLETIIQGGRNKVAMKSIDIATNPELRESRLFKSMWAYMKRSGGVIIRSYMMYKPLRFFSTVGIAFLIAGLIIGIRFLCLGASGHIQSLILMAILLLTGVHMIFMGFQADLIAANRKILEDIQFRVKKLECSEENVTEDLIVVDKKDGNN